MELLVGFSTHDGEHLIDDHAGMATYFDVYRLSKDNAEFVERRENSKYPGDPAKMHGDPQKAQASLSALKHLDVWANKKFGPNITRLLKKIMCVVVRTDSISEAIKLLQCDFDAVAEQCAKGEDRKHLVLRSQER